MIRSGASCADLARASASTSRAQILRDAGVAFDVHPAHVDEDAVKASGLDGAAVASDGDDLRLPVGRRGHGRLERCDATHDSYLAAPRGSPQEPHAPVGADARVEPFADTAKTLNCGLNFLL